MADSRVTVTTHYYTLRSLSSRRAFSAGTRIHTTYIHTSRAHRRRELHAEICAASRRDMSPEYRGCLRVLQRRRRGSIACAMSHCILYVYYICFVRAHLTSTHSRWSSRAHYATAANGSPFFAIINTYILIVL